MDDIEKYTAFLGKEIQVQIDRPKGSRHPRLDFIYETNYGFVPGTKAGDGHEIDVYVLDQDEALEEFRGLCIAVIIRKDDNEHKLIVAEATVELDQIIKQTNFVESYYDTEVILLKQDNSNSMQKN